MALQSLRLRNFTVFEDVTLEFCPGLNVIIGENGTGKSHAMKAAYSLLRAAPRRGMPHDPSSFPTHLKDKLKGVFRPKGDDVDRLVRRAPGCERADLWLRADDVQLDATLELDPPGPYVSYESSGSFAGRTVFLPGREILALYEGFVAAYESRELSFDETYYDTCKALSAALLRGARAERAQELLEPLREALGAEVFTADGRFYVKQGELEVEAHLLAEGLRKLASIYHLINNGSLTSDSILFWDEPEASLNPRLIERVAKFLLAMVGSGMQVIIASHDYLLTHRLSVMAEYAKLPEGTQVRFFAFTRSGGAGTPVEVEQGNTLADLSNNVILDEFARFYDDEQQLALGDK
jgi:predicted ATPase